MIRTGQLTIESNPLWYLDFKGVHGIQNNSRLPYFTMDNSDWPMLTKTQNSRLKDLLQFLRPLMQDTTFFYLLSMILMLDTSTLNEKDNGREVCLTKNTDPYDADLSVSLTKIDITTHLDIQRDENETDFSYDNRSRDDSSQVHTEKQRIENVSGITERFREIDKLRHHYLNLFISHCGNSPVRAIRKLIESEEELHHAISCINEVATYIESVFDLYKVE